MERRISNRVKIDGLYVEEKNGDYLYMLKAEDISEEGLFARGKVIDQNHEYVSHLSFRLPNMKHCLIEVPALAVRERRPQLGLGVGFHFVNMDEETRLLLKQYILERQSA